MTPAELEAIRERAEKATRGPWSYDDWVEEVRGPDDASVVRCGQIRGEPVLCISDADAAFIAHARTDVPALLSEINRLTLHVQRLQLCMREADELKDGLFADLGRERAEIERLTHHIATNPPPDMNAAQSRFWCWGFRDPDPAKNVDAMGAEIDRLRAALEGAKIPSDWHFPWCQHGEFGSMAGKYAKPCNCGACARNAAIDKVLRGES